MSDESSGLDHLLSFIDEQLEHLMSLSRLPRREFEESETLRLVAERRLEITAQACVDVAHRVLAMHDRSGVRAGAESIRELATLGVLPAEFARDFSGIASFRNVLAHMYVRLDWDLVYVNLQQAADIERFTGYVRAWLRSQAE